MTILCLVTVVHIVAFGLLINRTPNTRYWEVTDVVKEVFLTCTYFSEMLARRKGS